LVKTFHTHSQHSTTATSHYLHVNAENIYINDTKRTISAKNTETAKFLSGKVYIVISFHSK
jgi:hypothetical protein